MGYLRKVHDTPERAMQEIQAILRSNDIGQQTLAIQMEESNSQAINPKLIGVMKPTTISSASLLK